MRKIIKSNIKVLIAVIISGIIFSGIGVYASTTYLARDIKFTPINDNFKATNVEDALNTVYSRIVNQQNFLKIDYNSDVLQNVKLNGNKITATLKKLDTMKWYNTNLQYEVEPGNYKFTITGSTYGRFVFSPVNSYTHTIFDGNIYQISYKKSEISINFTESQTLYLWFSNDDNFENRIQCNIEIKVTKM